MPRSPLPGETGAPPPLPADNSPYGSALQSVRMDRDEIHRQLQAMTKDEREQIPDVAHSADAIYKKAMQVGSTLAELDLRDNRDTPEVIEKEIGKLEAEANPLDYSASEERVRRLAHLKRQRQEISGVSIDEEATHLIQYQHAYQAAARVISVMDSMLDVLINRTGAR